MIPTADWTTSVTLRAATGPSGWSANEIGPPSELAISAGVSSTSASDRSLSKKKRVS